MLKKAFAFSNINLNFVFTFRISCDTDFNAFFKFIYFIMWEISSFVKLEFYDFWTHIAHCSKQVLKLTTR